MISILHFQNCKLLDYFCYANSTIEKLALFRHPSLVSNPNRNERHLARSFQSKAQLANFWTLSLSYVLSFRQAPNLESVGRTESAFPPTQGTPVSRPSWLSLAWDDATDAVIGILLSVSPRLPRWIFYSFFLHFPPCELPSTRITLVEFLSRIATDWTETNQSDRVFADLVLEWN